MVVRNSVLLIDFIEIRLNDGVPMKQVIIDAGATEPPHFIKQPVPVVIGAPIILFDPICGLAICQAGAIVSTLLYAIVVPLIYLLWWKIKMEPHTTGKPLLPMKLEEVKSWALQAEEK